MIAGLPDRIGGIAATVVGRLAWLCHGRPSIDRDDLDQVACLAALRAIRRHGMPDDALVARCIRTAILRAACLAAPVSGRAVQEGAVAFGPAGSIEAMGIDTPARDERPEPWPTPGLLDVLDERDRRCIEAYYGGNQSMSDAARITGLHRQTVRRAIARSLEILRS